MTDVLQQTNNELHDMTEQLQSELALARTIQQSLLPPAAPALPSLDTLCYSQPAREVGGDFYSYYQFDDSRVALAVGDVSGKGASAALLMATSLSLFNTHVEQTQSPAVFMANLDRNMLPYTQPQRQNCALTYLELDRHALRIVNAGGIPPFIRRRSGFVEWPDAWGFALGQGLGAQTGYELTQLSLEEDDLIVLVSDGLVEAKNRQGQLWGFDRLQRAIETGPAQTAQAMTQHLLACVQAFVGTTEPHDDMTIVIVRVCARAIEGGEDVVDSTTIVPTYAA
jgi:serine phosphatase RsbU (regulator of sigma subunit)